MRDPDHDLEMCEKATAGPWGKYGHKEPTQGSLEAAPGLSMGSIHHTEPIARFSGYLLPVEDNTNFCIEAREALPHWIVRAQAAETENKRLTELYADTIKITKQEAPHVLLSIVSCLDDSLYLDPETEEALIAVYDRIQQMFAEEENEDE